MILVFDIGNTNIKIALFSKEEIIKKWRLPSNPKFSVKKYYSLITKILIGEKLKDTVIEDAVISSVVPKLTPVIAKTVKKIWNIKALVINTTIYNKLSVTIPESAINEIGTDLLCDALAAWTKYKKASIIVDFGTALSFTALDQNGNISGIAITPGIGTAIKALFQNTAQLPEIPLEIPESSLGKNTIWSIQAGILFGYKGLIESMINQMKNDLHKEKNTNTDEIVVIATGGLNGILKNKASFFTNFEDDLTLHGIKRALKEVRENEN